MGYKSKRDRRIASMRNSMAREHERRQPYWRCSCGADFEKLHELEQHERQTGHKRQERA